MNGSLAHLKKGVLEAVVLSLRRVVYPHRGPGLGQQSLLFFPLVPHGPLLDGLVVLPRFDQS